MYQNLGGGFVMKKMLLGFIFICACTTTYAYPKDINITKSEGAYIRGHFTWKKLYMSKYRKNLC